MTESEYSKVVATNLRRIMFERDKKPADVCRDLDISKATISSWMNATRTPKMPKIDLLCKYFNCSRADLMEPVKPDTVRCIRIPVLGRVAAGQPTEAIKDVVDYVEIPEAWHGDYFALKVRGLSMSPRIVEDDILIVERTPEAESGDIVIAQVNGDDATVKKLIITPSGITLQPLNPEFAPLFFNTDQIADLPVKILGKVVECRHRF